MKIHKDPGRYATVTIDTEDDFLLIIKSLYAIHGWCGLSETENRRLLDIATVLSNYWYKEGIDDEDC